MSTERFSPTASRFCEIVGLVILTFLGACMAIKTETRIDEISTRYSERTVRTGQAEPRLDVSLENGRVRARITERSICMRQKVSQHELEEVVTRTTPGRDVRALVWSTVPMAIVGAYCLYLSASHEDYRAATAGTGATMFGFAAAFGSVGIANLIRARDSRRHLPSRESIEELGQAACGRIRPGVGYSITLVLPSRPTRYAAKLTDDRGVAVFDLREEVAALVTISEADSNDAYVTYEDLRAGVSLLDDAIYRAARRKAAAEDARAAHEHELAEMDRREQEKRAAERVAKMQSLGAMLLRTPAAMYLASDEAVFCNLPTEPSGLPEVTRVTTRRRWVIAQAGEFYGLAREDSNSSPSLSDVRVWVRKKQMMTEAEYQRMLAKEERRRKAEEAAQELERAQEYSVEPQGIITSYKVTVVSQSRCTDGDEGSVSRKPDELQWIVSSTGMVSAHLRSWDKGSATRDLWLTGRPSGSTVVLAGESSGMAPMEHRLQSILSKGKPVRGSMETSSRRHGCTIYREIQVVDEVAAQPREEHTGPLVSEGWYKITEQEVVRDGCYDPHGPLGIEFKLSQDAEKLDLAVIVDTGIYFHLLGTVDRRNRVSAKWDGDGKVAPATMRLQVTGEFIRQGSVLVGTWTGSVHRALEECSWEYRFLAERTDE
ncbi:MAG: hypothetical protein V2A73_01325 [Pseudomonadota bacterium]